MSSFVLVGDLMVDVSAIAGGPLNYASDTTATVSVQPGGSASNTASWMAALGEEAHLVGILGEDALGDMFVDILTSRGVVLHVARTSAAQTGICVVLVDQKGERTMMPDAGANSFLTTANIPDDIYVRRDHLHLSGYTLLNPKTRKAGLAILERAADAGMSISLDPASAAPILANPSLITSVLENIDLLLANADEATALTGLSNPSAALESLSEMVATVVIKCGAAGAMARHGTEVCQAPAFLSSVVDTTGAGDAFAAGFLPRWKRKEPLTACLGAGLRKGAQAITRVGAGPKGT